MKHSLLPAVTGAVAVFAISCSPTRSQDFREHSLRHMFMFGRPVARISRPPSQAPATRVQFNARVAAEKAGFKAVSSLVNFPRFFPGLGMIYVRPSTLPLGPFICFDRNDNIMSTVYMVPIKDFDDKKAFNLTQMVRQGDHLTIYFNAGHPGVPMPHYHIVVWHVPKQREYLVAK